MRLSKKIEKLQLCTSIGLRNYLEPGGQLLRKAKLSYKAEEAAKLGGETSPQATSFKGCVVREVYPLASGGGTTDQETTLYRTTNIYTLPS